MRAHDFKPKGGPHVGVVLIDEAYVGPHSVVAALMSAAYEAAARVAEGAMWEGDEEILIPPAARPHALRMAAIWRSAADHLQNCVEPVSGGEPAPVASAPERSAPAGSGAP